MSQPSNNTEHLDDRYPETSYQQEGTASHYTEEDDDGLLTLRSLVSTKEAGVIIGKGRKNACH